MPNCKNSVANWAMDVRYITSTGLESVLAPCVQPCINVHGFSKTQYMYLMDSDINCWILNGTVKDTDEN
jgi:hypothetical protein